MQARVACCPYPCPARLVTSPEQVGTSKFAAPEVLGRDYDKNAGGSIGCAVPHAATLFVSVLGFPGRRGAAALSAYWHICPS